MNASAEKIVSEALHLPASVKSFLAEKLIESLDMESDFNLSPKWKKEIRRRCKEIDQGAVQLRDAQAVFEKAYSALA